MPNIILFFRQELDLTQTKDRRHKLKSMINNVETCEPFTALGYYSVGKSTVTSTLGTVLTYLIILLQTVTCPNKESVATSN